MKINLNDISDKGKSFELSPADGQLDNSISEVGCKSYRVIFSIAPVSNHFEIRGSVEYEIEGECSMCAEDQISKIEYKIYGILMERIKIEGESHGSSSSESPDDLTTIPVDAGIFSVGEFIYETMVVNYSNYPLCGGSKCLNESLAKENIESLNSKENSVFAPDINSGFAKLKGLKINH